MSTLRDFMSAKDLAAMTGDKGRAIPTWHTVCLEKTGVARPGKTARDRARGVIK